MSNVSCLCINEESEFGALVDDWNRLAALTDPDSVFFRHEWFDAAWRWLSAECELAIICVIRDSRPIGVCPLVLRRTKQMKLTARTLEFLAVPDTHECDILAAPEDAEIVAEAIVELLDSGRLRWDLMLLDKFRPNSFVMEKFALAAERRGLDPAKLEVATSPGISLDGTWQDYYARRSRRLKKGNNLIVNRLKRAEKTWEIRRYDQSGEDFDLGGLLQTVTNLSAASWKADTGLTLDNHGPAAFITTLSDHAQKHSWLLVWILTIDGEPAAMEYQLNYNGVVSGLRADYDLKFHDDSPGTLLNWKIIEALFDGDASYYSLGPGSNTYKMRWTEDLRELPCLRMFAPSMRGSILRTIEKYGRPLMRKVRSLTSARDSDD